MPRPPRRRSAGATPIDIASALSAVVATALALVAIVVGNRQAGRAAARLVRERRIDFELDVLGDLLEAIDLVPHTSGSAQTIRRCLLLLGRDPDMARLRALQLAEENETSAWIQEVREQAMAARGASLFDEPTSNGMTLRETLARDVRAAITHRLTERDAERPRRRDDRASGRRQ